MICCLVLGAFPVTGDEVYTKNQRANKLYQQGRYQEALKLYDDALLTAPTDPRLKANRGSALYKLGQFDQAEGSYKDGLTEKDKNALADAHYNLGNALFRQGQQQAQQQGGQQGQGGDPQEKLRGALDEYKAALDLRPADKDAKWNLQLTEAVLEQLKKQQQENKDKKDQDKKDDKDNKDNKDQKDQQKKDQDKQNQDKKDQEKKDQEKKDQEHKQDKQDQQQKPPPQPSPQQQDMKKEQAAKLLEQYSDDDKKLNKPMKQVQGVEGRKIEKDW